MRAGFDASLLQDMYGQLSCSHVATTKLVEEQELNHPDHQVIVNKYVKDICNVVKKPREKNADKIPDRVEPVSVMVWEHLKLAVVLFQHR